MTNKRKPSKAQIEKAYAAAVSRYSGRDNVTGIDKGYQYNDGKRTENIVVRIHVREKLTGTALEAAGEFPKEIEGVALDVIEAQYRISKGPEDQATNARKIARDPMQPGISVGHYNVSAGTLGTYVYDNRNGNKCILSNWHVLAGSSSAQTGDPVLQPGSFDGGSTQSDTVASLSRRIINAHGDAAIAELNRLRGTMDGQFETGVQVTQAEMAQIGDLVVKSGRSTSVTAGLVDGIGRYPINYGGTVGTVFVEGFRIVSRTPGNPDDEEISSGGDSGSVWYKEQNNVGVGLHFAGETNPTPNAEEAIACHLPSVLRELDVSLMPPTETAGDHGDLQSLSNLERKIDRILALLESGAKTIRAQERVPGITPEMTLYQVRAVIAADTRRSIDRVGENNPLSTFYSDEGALRDFYMRLINNNPFNCVPPVSVAEVGLDQTVSQLSGVVDIRRTS